MRRNPLLSTHVPAWPSTPVYLHPLHSIRAPLIPCLAPPNQCPALSVPRSSLASPHPTSAPLNSCPAQPVPLSTRALLIPYPAQSLLNRCSAHPMLCSTRAPQVVGLPDLWAMSTARHPSADLMPTRHLGPPPPEVIAVPATATLPEVRAAATRALRYTYRMFRPRLLKPGASAALAGAGAAAAGEVLQHEQPPGFEVSRIVAGLPHQVWGTKVWTCAWGVGRP